MLRLTRTAMGLLTAQYRSVLRKCWAINVGVFALGAMAATAPNEAVAAYVTFEDLSDAVDYVKEYARDNYYTKDQVDSDYLHKYIKINAASGASSDYPTAAAVAYGYGSIAIGDSSVASQLTDTATTERYATAFGYSNTASEQYSSAFGWSNTASGKNSSAVGWMNTASGTSSSAFGYSNTASGINSSAFGDRNTASGKHASAVGYSNTAYGYGSSAFGYHAQAGDSSDDTINPDTQVTTSSKDKYATAIGSYVQATGLYALALGNQKSGMTQTMASGTSAIAIGTGAQATHDNSVAIGTGAVASSTNAVVIGTNSADGGADTISVGSDTIKRRIVNVGEGTDGSHDAVAMSQLGNIEAGTKILNPNGTSAISFGTNTDQITVGQAFTTLANHLDNNYYRKNKKSGILNGVKGWKKTTFNTSSQNSAKNHKSAFFLSISTLICSIIASNIGIVSTLVLIL